jgi:hypothetical protein
VKVRIIKCAEDTYWYAGHIGDEFEVEDYINRHHEYTVRHEKIIGGFLIAVDDCIVVEQ